MNTKYPLAAAGLLLAAAGLCAQETPKPAAEPTFATPRRLEAGGATIRIEEPGYAAPCWADVTGDGKKDLLVGQFAGGKIMVYPNIGEGKLGKGSWLQAEGKVAEVPGVW